MTKRAAYVQDPIDGLPARVVRSWSRRKHHYLDRYAGIFSTGMKKWERRTYLDLFAGPGRCCEQETGEFYDGSPLIALKHGFTDYIYVELDEQPARALQDRCRRQGKPTLILPGDCNSRVGQVVRAMPSNGIALAFLDPTSWQIRFSTVRALAENRRVDLVVSFFGGMMKRVVQYEQPTLDAFFGTKDWRADRYMGPDGQPTLSGLLAAYRDQLATIGYLDMVSTREIEVKNTNMTTMYLMAFFSKHKLGYKFWDEITTEDEKGQLAIRW